MEVYKAIAAMLESQGAWLIVTVLSGTVVTMARYITKIHATQREDDRKTISMLEKFKASVDALTKAVDRLADRS